LPTLPQWAPLLASRNDGPTDSFTYGWYLLPVPMRSPSLRLYM